MISNFNFFLDTRIEFGVGTIEKLGDIAKEFNPNKVCIVTDSNLLKIGLAKEITTILDKNNLNYCTFDKVEPNPSIDVVDMCGQMCRNENCDLILAFGGGSSIDTAKGAAVIATNEGSCFDYLDGRLNNKKEILADPLPIIAIPTTSGTGSEVSQYAVITDLKTKIKDSISTAKIYPRVAIVDPNFTIELPSFATASTGLDVLAHAIEAYTSKIDNAFTDIMALEAIKIVFYTLPACVNKKDVESRTKMSFASLIAGIAMSHCGATIPHAMGCPLSGYHDIPHGLAVGVLQIPMIKFNKDVLAEKFLEIINYVSYESNKYAKENAADILIEKIKKLLKDINIDEKIAISDIKIDEMSKDASIHGALSLNQRDVNIAEIKEIYQDVTK